MAIIFPNGLTDSTQETIISRSARNQPDLLYETIKEMDDMNKTSNYSNAKINTYIVLTVLAMLPSAAVGINFITQLLKDFLRHLSFENLNATMQNETILSEVGVVAAWFIPLLLGLIAAKFLVDRRKVLPAALLGFVLISICYWLLSMQVGRIVKECIDYLQPHCEFAALGYLIYLGMWGANVGALIGFVVLANQIQLKRDSDLGKE
jgi:hypothetical protein